MRTPPLPPRPLALWPVVAIALLLTLPAAAPRAQTAPAVVDFALYDADTDEQIRNLTPTDELDLSELPTTNLSIVANVAGDVGSVRFAFAGEPNYQTENAAPYALNGDTNGDLNPVPELAQPGAYTLVATPYTGANAGGTAGDALTLQLTVVEGGGGSGGPDGDGSVTLIGVADHGAPAAELYRYRPVTLTLDGPFASEGQSPNPFLDRRFDVVFTAPSGAALRIPGYFAADGDAAETSATEGTAWRAHLTPSEAGTWSYTVAFRAGAGVAVADDADAGSPLAPYDGTSGTFAVGAAPVGSPGNYARGPLRYVGERYLRFDSGEPFLKGGADSPENLLAYEDFDNTSNYGGTNYVKSWAAHVQDWAPGDPTWQGDKGKGLVGALNYLASEGMNAFSFLPFNAPQGDGKDVWPWRVPTDPLRYDVSKLAQWDVVFGHADRLGLFLHFKTQETENDQYLDGGALGTERRLYYRELVARFGYHMALNWNLGEENTNTDEQRRSFAEHFDRLDPYDHPIVVHTYPGQYEDVYGDLLGDPHLTGASIQLGGMSGGHDVTLEWLDRSAQAGRPWHVALDEPGNAGTGVTCDGAGNNHAAAREEALWANLMAGGTGVEWYFGYQTCAGDLNAQDWRTRDRLWDYTRHALTFFREYLPFPEMESADDLSPASGDYVLAQPGEVYAVYAPDAGAVRLDLPDGTFDVRWFDPRNGGGLQTGAVASVDGGGTRDLGAPPSDSGADWVALVTSDDGSGTPGPVLYAVNAGGGALTTDGGTAYRADAGFSGGRRFATADPIVGTDDDALYQSVRYGTFSYSGPVANGSYEVTLRFAEVFWTELGRRVFSVEAEGEPIVTDLDLFAVAGHDVAYDVTATVEVTDGRLDLAFIPSVGDAGVSAIVVREPGGANALAVTPATAPVEVYPNPAAGEATFGYSLIEPAAVRLEVYDVLGRRVAVLVSASQEAGPHRVRLDGSALPSGTYHWRLVAGERRETGQLTLAH